MLAHILDKPYYGSHSGILCRFPAGKKRYGCESMWLRDDSTIRDRGIFIFPVQLTTSMIGNITRLIHTLLYVMAIHTIWWSVSEFQYN